jgi:hypothetical protein
MIGRTAILVSFLLSGSALLAARSGDYSVEALKGGAPAGIAEPVRAALAPSGYRVLGGGRPALDFWFRAALLTVDPKPEKGVHYGALKQGALVGVVRIHEGAVDFRAQKVAAGLYTMRYAVQPDDGDHQDMTEARDFLLLSAALDDLSPETMDWKPLVKQSARLNGKKHPGVLSLAAGQDGPLPRIRTQGEPAQVVFEAEVPGSGGKPLRLTIVVVGKYKE